MIQQIPRQVSIASLNRTRQLSTTIADYSIHHITPELFDGYIGTETQGYLATAEKALFDTVYIRAPRGGKVHLPELSLPHGFDEARLHQWTSRIAAPRLETLVTRGLDETLAHASREWSP